MLLNRFTHIIKLITNVNVKLPNVASTQVNFFSSKAPNQPVTIEVDGEKRKLKRQAIPRITLISPDDSISIVTLEEAQLLSKRRDLKLVKVVDVDAKTQRPLYKLMTGVQYHAEELKQREERKKNKSASFLKGEKLLMLNSTISNHDLEVNINKILKWIAKRYEVRVIVNGNSSSKENLVRYIYLTETLWI